MADEDTHIVLGGIEVAIRVLDQDALLDRIIAEDGDLDRRNPYFGQIWPASRVLGEWLASASLAEARVLDLGCGTGLLGIVAARRGARVTFADVMEESLELARSNARRNAVHGVFRKFDLREPPLDLPEDERYDIVLASDVLYEPWMADALARALTVLLRKDGRARIADPSRPSGDGMKKSLRRHGFAVDVTEDLVEAGDKVVVVRTFEARRE